jgi:hypothetical protein
MRALFYGKSEPSFSRSQSDDFCLVLVGKENIFLE